MTGLYWASVTLHVLAAIFWLGGMFFFAAVGAPVLRTVEPPSARAALFHALGTRFRTIGWIVIGVLLATGILNLHFRGVLDPAVLGSWAFWDSRFGQTLMWKLIAVTAMLLFSAAHDFVLGPRAGRLAPESTAGARARRGASWLARLNALLGLVVVLTAVRLARGG